MKTETVDRRNLLQGKGYLFNLIGNFSFIDFKLVFVVESVSFFLSCSSLIKVRFCCCFFFVFFLFLSTEDDLAEVLVEIFACFSYFTTG